MSPLGGCTGGCSTPAGRPTVTSPTHTMSESQGGGALVQCLKRWGPLLAHSLCLHTCPSESHGINQGGPPASVSSLSPTDSGVCEMCTSQDFRGHMVMECRVSGGGGRGGRGLLYLGVSHLGRFCPQGTWGDVWGICACHGGGLLALSGWGAGRLPHTLTVPRTPPQRML